jgi:hypothetical protein
MTTNQRSDASTDLDFKKVWKEIPRLDLSKVKSPSWLIDFFLAEGSIQLVYGSFGTRKTTAMLLAAWSVSQGIPFLGKKTRRRCVLYLDYENPAGVLKSYCHDLGIDPSNPWFVIWDRSEAAPPVPGEEPLDDQRLANFIRRCKKVTGDYPWIIFDSWTSLLKSDASGDKISDAAPIFRQIRSYRDSGASCTIIDHTGKGRKKDPIGTSAKMTQMDSAHLFCLDAQETDPFNPNFHRVVIRVESCLKRYAPANVGTFSFEVCSAVDEKGVWHLMRPETTKDKAERQFEYQIDQIKKLINDNPSAGVEELVRLARKIRLEKSRKSKIGSRNARKLLEAGTGTHWESTRIGPRKQVFRVIKTPKL